MTPTWAKINKSETVVWFISFSVTFLGLYYITNNNWKVKMDDFWEKCLKQVNNKWLEIFLNF